MITKEFRIAFSKRAQPAWIRVVKWTLFIGVARLTYGTPWFSAWLIGLPTVGLIVHFFYRWKTHGWTRPWGGWSDIEANRDR